MEFGNKINSGFYTKFLFLIGFFKDLSNSYIELFFGEKKMVKNGDSKNEN